MQGKIVNVIRFRLIAERNLYPLRNKATVVNTLAIKEIIFPLVKTDCTEEDVVGGEGLGGGSSNGSTNALILFASSSFSAICTVMSASGSLKNFTISGDTV